MNLPCFWSVYGGSQANVLSRIFGIFWKCARIGERLSPYISMCCIAMAVSTISSLEAMFKADNGRLGGSLVIRAGRHDKLAFKELEGDIPWNIHEAPAVQ